MDQRQPLRPPYDPSPTSVPLVPTRRPHPSCTSGHSHIMGEGQSRMSAALHRELQAGEVTGSEALRSPRSVSSPESTLVRALSAPGRRAAAARCGLGVEERSWRDEQTS